MDYIDARQTRDQFGRLGGKDDRRGSKLLGVPSGHYQGTESTDHDILKDEIMIGNGRRSIA